MNYSREQLEFIKTNYRLHSMKQLVVLFNETFNTDCTDKQLKSCCANHKMTSGRTGCFEKGHTTWNKNTKGLTHRNKTTFQKGHMPANRKPIGSERICSKDGYILIKVEIPDPYTKSKTRYMFKHVYIWEMENGKVPSGHVVVFKDGDKLNCKINNLILMKRSELAVLNHLFPAVSGEEKLSAIALSKLIHKVAQCKRKKRS